VASTHSLATHGDKTTAGDIATNPRRNNFTSTKKLNYGIQVRSSTANALEIRYVVGAQFRGGMLGRAPKYSHFSDGVRILESYQKGTSHEATAIDSCS
jgi:hypothetical protein